MSYTQNIAARNANGRDNIRLFRILNSRSERRQRMRCEVQMFSLQQAPRYSALSYCWRTDDESELVEFQGSLRGTRSISRDLASAIRTVQVWQKDDWLWVDTICIDQSEVAEKNDQVPRMQMIYEGARNVTIWLGEAVPDRREAYYPKHTATPLDFARNAELGLTRNKVDQLCDLSAEGRAWWSRVWVIQEMVVAANLYVCIGPQIVHWNKFKRATSYLDWYGNPYTEADLMAISARISQLNRLRESWRENKYSLTVLELLDMGRKSYATDARDNIYGLLGLMRPEDKRQICVDYNRTPNVIYAEVTAMLIKTQRSLDFLVRCFSDSSLHSQPSLPSWVLDFGDCQGPISDTKALAGDPEYFELPSGGFIQRTPGEEYQASASTTPSIRLDASSLKLQLQAVLFDNIVATTITRSTVRGTWYSEHNEISDTKNTENGWEWLESAVGLLKAAFRKEVLPSDPRSDLCRKNDIISNLPGINEESQRWLSEQLLVESDCHFDNSLLDMFSEQWITESFFSSITEISSTSLLFRTTSGFAGFAGYDKRPRHWHYGHLNRDQSACPDDVVAIPLGCSKPWILRETEVKGEYRLIVDCVVPDIMDGEVMNLVEAGQMEAEWITLV